MAKASDPHAGDLKRLRSLLGGIAKRHPEEKSVTDEVHSLLARILPDSAAPDALPQKRSGVGVRYEVRRSGTSSALYELRPGGAPLRVGQDVFLGVTDVLASANRPLSHDEIGEEMPKQLMASEWQIRVVLRFLQKATPPILRRSRSRYAASESKKFLMETERHWQRADQP